MKACFHTFGGGVRFSLFFLPKCEMSMESCFFVKYMSYNFVFSDQEKKSKKAYFWAMCGLKRVFTQLVVSWWCGVTWCCVEWRGVV